MEKSIISVELGDESIKLCEAAFSKRENPAFRFAAKKLSWKNSNISEEITALFRTRNFRAKKIFLNIPRFLVMARIIRLPSVNEDEIKNMAKMEAVKQMPYRDEDIITGHRVIEKLADGYSSVLLVISQVSTISRFITILENSGFTVEKIALSSESLFAWHAMLKEKSKELSSAALVNLDSEYIDMAIMDKGRLVFTRAFSYGYGEEDKTKKAIDEIKASLATYQKERSSAVDKILLTGADARVNAIEPLLTGEVRIPVERIHQSEGIELAENADALFGEVSFVGLIGLSSRPENIEINLFPREMAENKEFRIFKKALTKTLVLLGCVIFISLGIAAQKIFDKYSALRILNSRIESAEPRVLKARKMRDDMKIIKSEIEKRPLAIQIISEIYRITPADISFNLIDYTSDKGLVIRGASASLEGIVRFIKILEDSKYFENVKLKYTAKRAEGSPRGEAAGAKQKTDFEITCYPEGKKTY